MVSNRCREASRSGRFGHFAEACRFQRRNAVSFRIVRKITIRPHDAGNLSLPPGQALGFPAGRDAAMAVGVRRPLEPVGDVVGVRESRRLRRLRRGEAALAAAADEVDVVLRREAGLLQLVGERGVALPSSDRPATGSAPPACRPPTGRARRRNSTPRRSARRPAAPCGSRLQGFPDLRWAAHSRPWHELRLHEDGDDPTLPRHALAGRPGGGDRPDAADPAAPCLRGDRLHHPRQGGVHEPRRIGEGPRRSLHHHRRRKARRAEAGRHASSRAPPATPASA